jgi:hypothetical protein
MMPLKLRMARCEHIRSLEVSTGTGCDNAMKFHREGVHRAGVLLSAIYRLPGLSTAGSGHLRAFVDGLAGSDSALRLTSGVRCRLHCMGWPDQRDTMRNVESLKQCCSQRTSSTDKRRGMKGGNASAGVCIVASGPLVLVRSSWSSSCAGTFHHASNHPSRLLMLPGAQMPWQCN